MNQLGFDKSTVYLPQFNMPQMRFLKASTQRNKLQNELQSYLQSLITNQTFCYNDIKNMYETILNITIDEHYAVQNCIKFM